MYYYYKEIYKRVERKGSWTWGIPRLDAAVACTACAKECEMWKERHYNGRARASVCVPHFFRLLLRTHGKLVCVYNTYPIDVLLLLRVGEFHAVFQIYNVNFSESDFYIIRELRFPVFRASMCVYVYFLLVYIRKYRAGAFRRGGDNNFVRCDNCICVYTYTYAANTRCIYVYCSSFHFA